MKRRCATKRKAAPSRRRHCPICKAPERISGDGLFSSHSPFAGVCADCVNRRPAAVDRLYARLLSRRRMR